MFIGYVIPLSGSVNLSCPLMRELHEGLVKSTPDLKTDLVPLLLVRGSVPLKRPSSLQ